MLTGPSSPRVGQQFDESAARSVHEAALQQSSCGITGFLLGAADSWLWRVQSDVNSRLRGRRHQQHELHDERRIDHRYGDGATIEMAEKAGRVG